LFLKFSVASVAVLWFLRLYVAFGKSASIVCFLIDSSTYTQLWVNFGNTLYIYGKYFEKSFNMRFTNFDLLKRQHPTNPTPPTAENTAPPKQPKTHSHKPPMQTRKQHTHSNTSPTTASLSNG
jgi:hypothetical protein